MRARWPWPRASWALHIHLLAAWLHSTGAFLSPASIGPSHGLIVTSPSRSAALHPRGSPSAVVLQVVVGTGGGGRRGRGRGGDGDDGRPVNMSDEQYDEFFRDRMKQRMVNYEDKVEAGYYEGVDKNVRFSDDPDAWDGTPDAFTRISRDQALKVGVGAALATAGFMAAQRWHLLRRYTSPTAFIHSYDSQTARRPFTIEQLRSAVRKASNSKYSGLPDAPSLSSSLNFLRGSREDVLSSMNEGRAVIYCWWRASNANSVPVLRKLEGMLSRIGTEDLDVVSIHSPKYDGESSDAAVEDAVRRVEYSVGAPLLQKVVNDPGLSLWKDKGLDCWPTVAVAAPRTGKVVFVAVGERATGTQFLENAICAVLEVLRGRDEDSDKEILDTTTTTTTLPPYEEGKARQLRDQQVQVQGGGGPLAFPADVAVDAAADRIYIADTGNHRIVVTDLQGRLVRIIGSGLPGLRDGYKAEAQFDSPQGLALDRGGGLLYVADTLNDHVRVINLNREADVVSTLKPSNLAPSKRREVELGNVREDLVRALGEEGKDPLTSAELGSRRALRLPTQLAILDGNLYIAATGSNQIWRFDPYDFDLRPFLGSGEMAIKNRRDTRLSDLSAASALAQPTGLAALPGRLLVAEAESSTVREVDFTQKLSPLSTLFGNDKLFPQDLSAFGDHDGYARNVRLQMPTGLCSLQGRGDVLLSDSYNHKVKLISLIQGAVETGGAPADASCRTIAGSGRAGFKDGPGYAAEFNEPRGLAYDAFKNRAFVCDTNNHAIRVIDVERATVTTLPLSGFPSDK